MSKRPKKPDSIHPLCAMFPPLSPEDWESLAASISDHGYDATCPIVRWRGQVLDGQHRLAICRRLGVEPTWDEFDGSEAEAVALVMRRNLARRHMTPGQRALVADELSRYSTHGDERRLRPRKPNEPLTEAPGASFLPKTPRGGLQQNPNKPAPLDTMSSAAGTLQVGTKTVERVRWIREHGTPDDLERVRQGRAPTTVVREITQAATHQLNSDVKHDAETDAAGRPIPDGLRDALVVGRAEFIFLRKQVQELKRRLMDLQKRMPLGRLMRGAEIEQDTRNIVSAIDAAAPHTSCVRCAMAGGSGGSGGQYDESCKDCQGTGWITAGTWAGVPQSVRARL